MPSLAGVGRARLSQIENGAVMVRIDASKGSNDLHQLKTMPVASSMSMRNDGLGLSEVKDGALYGKWSCGPDD